MVSSIKVEGIDILVKTLRDMGDRVREIYGVALYQEGLVVAAEARRVCPVAPHGSSAGVLRDTIQTHEAEVSENNITVAITAGGPATPYAIAVHEHLSESSPPSWKKAEASGKGIHWNAAGTGPKFIEKPLLAMKQTMGDRIAARVQGRLRP